MPEGDDRMRALITVLVALAPVMAQAKVCRAPEGLRHLEPVKSSPTLFYAMEWSKSPKPLKASEGFCQPNKPQVRPINR